MRCFQPLMGNGNYGRSYATGSRANSSNPSWGTGTYADCKRDTINRVLPTPHGEREPMSVASLNIAGRTFQPLMGNGNLDEWIGKQPRYALPTPHGEREPCRRC